MREEYCDPRETCDEKCATLEMGMNPYEEEEELFLSL